MQTNSMLRWAIIRKTDGQVIEGGVYTKRSKANKRLYGCALPDNFKLAQAEIKYYEPNA